MKTQCSTYCLISMREEEEIRNMSVDESGEDGG